MVGRSGGLGGKQMAAIALPRVDACLVDGGQIDDARLPPRLSLLTAYPLTTFVARRAGTQRSLR